MAKYEEIKQGTIFPAGVLNPYGEFFVGDTYLTNLVTSPDDKSGLDQYHLSRVHVITGTFTMMVIKFYLSQLVKVGTKKKGNQRNH